MIATVVKISCDWCDKWDEARKNLVDLKGKPIRVGEISFRKKCEKHYGWLSTVKGNGDVLDFCSKECYDEYKKQ